MMLLLSGISCERFVPRRRALWLVSVVVAIAITPSRASVGCSDGTCEGLCSETYVNACKATWASSMNLRSDKTGSSCGNNLTTCSVPADACSDGWSMCSQVNEMYSISTSECSALSGKYVMAMSHCVSWISNVCDYGNYADYGCSESGYCSEAVCCGAGCSSNNKCDDGVWAGATEIAPDPCGDFDPGDASGVLCCWNGQQATASPTYSAFSPTPSPSFRKEVNMSFWGMQYDYMDKYGEMVAYATAIDPITQDVYIAGSTNDYSTSYQDSIFVYKLSQTDGAVSWERSWGSSTANAAFAMTLDEHSNPVVAGCTTLNLFGALHNNGYSDYFVMKLLPSDSVLWGVQGGFNDTYTAAMDVDVDAAGNIFVIVLTCEYKISKFSTTCTDEETTRNYLIKLSGNDGSELWRVEYAGQDSLVMGLCLGVSQDSAVVYIGGQSAGNYFEGPPVTSSWNQAMYFLLKVSGDDGSVLWGFQNGTGDDKFASMRGIQVTSGETSEEVYVVIDAYLFYSVYIYDRLVMKYNGDEEGLQGLVWSNVLYGTYHESSNGDVLDTSIRPLGIAVKCGYVYTGGYVQGSVYATASPDDGDMILAEKFDADNGELVWGMQYGTYDGSTSISHVYAIDVLPTCNSDDTASYYNTRDGLVLAGTTSGSLFSANDNRRDAFASINIVCLGGYEFGPTDCVPCDPGSTSPIGPFECLPCPVGTYTDEYASVNCTICPDGSTTNVTGANSSQVCGQCVAGTFSTEGGSCIKCPPGTSSSGEGNTGCSDCSAGTYTSSAGSPHCKSCESILWSTGASTECSRVLINLSPLNIALVALSIAVVTTVFIVYSKMQFRLACMVFLSTADLASDILYVFYNEFFSMELFVLCLVFIFLPYVFSLLYNIHLYQMSLNHFIEGMLSLTPDQLKGVGIRVVIAELDEDGYPAVGGVRLFPRCFTKADNLFLLILLVMSYVAGVVLQVLYTLLLGVPFICVVVLYFLSVLACVFVWCAYLLVTSIVGFYFMETKLLSHCTIWNLFAQMLFLPEAKANVSAIGEKQVDRHMLNLSVLMESMLESLPQLIVQAMNNYYTRQYNTIAIGSMIFGGVMIVDTLYKMFYYRLYQNVPFADIPSMFFKDDDEEKLASRPTSQNILRP